MAKLLLCFYLVFNTGRVSRLQRTYLNSCINFSTIIYLKRIQVHEKKISKTILFKTILVYSDVFKNVCVLLLPIKEYSLKKYLMQELLAITDFQNIHVLDLHALK